MQRLVLFLGLLLPIVYSQTCQGTWSDWTVAAGGECTKNCGMCGTESQARICSPDGCTCDGDSTRTVACGQKVCLYPDLACCAGYKKVVSSSGFICVPV